MNLVNTCPACGAEEALDVLIGRMIEDDDARRLIADVLCMSLPLGGLVVRYLRLFKPAKQRLRFAKAKAVLAELVPDMKRGAITRKGREWHAPVESWKLALEAVFEAADKGTLTPPLDGNAYLYEVLLRHADRWEAQAERSAEASKRSGRAPGGAPVSVSEALAVATAKADSAQAAPRALVLDPRPRPGPGLAARRRQAEMGLLKLPQSQTDDETKGSDQ